MYHLRLKGDHYQMGVKRGKTFQKSNIIFPLHLDNFQLEHGRKSEQMIIPGDQPMRRSAFSAWESPFSKCRT